MNSGTEHMEVIKTAVERAARLAQAGDPAQAELICRETLEHYPTDGNLLCLLGALLLRQRRPEDAESPLRLAIEKYPDFARAHEELGNALIARGNTVEATACFNRVIGLEPENATVQFKLSQLLEQTGHPKEAAEAKRTASRLAPDQEARAAADQLIHSGRFTEAEKIYRGLLTRDQNNPEYLCTLGRLVMEQKQFGDAIVMLRRAIEVAPESVQAWTQLAEALIERGEFNEAAAAASTSIRLESRNTQSWLILGKALAFSGDYHGASEAFGAGLKLQPDNVGCLSGLGHALRTVGRYQEAVEHYQHSIRVLPTFGEGYWNLANLKDFRFDATHMQAMQEHIDDAQLNDDSRIYLRFALGKAFEDQGDYSTAFEHYTHGNSARRMQASYDPVQTEATHDQIIDTFTSEFLGSRVDAQNPEPAPIFIVGLPRSGSTLIEQILASHSQVEGTHELPCLPRIVQYINRQLRGALGYPATLQHFDAEMLAELGQQYLHMTAQHRSGSPFFTDKLPNNFMHVGLLHLILPNAKIINARRHPLDSCMGSYKQLFATGQSFTYDLVELGEYYLQYQRIMDHWNAVLPGKVLDVHYEDIVMNQETQTRRMLEHCEIPWEDACLAFYETQRAIATVSSEQVRQPIYQTSVNHWRNYESELAELSEILSPVLSAATG